MYRLLATFKFALPYLADTFLMQWMLLLILARISTFICVHRERQARVRTDFGEEYTFYFYGTQIWNPLLYTASNPENFKSQ